MRNTWEDYIDFFLAVCAWFWKPALCGAIWYFLNKALGFDKAVYMAFALLFYKWLLED